MAYIVIGPYRWAREETLEAAAKRCAEAIPPEVFEGPGAVYAYAYECDATTGVDGEGRLVVDPRGTMPVALEAVDLREARPEGLDR